MSVSDESSKCAKCGKVKGEHHPNLRNGGLYCQPLRPSEYGPDSPMFTPASEYRELGPDEVVQEGDECAAKNADSSKEGNWSLACRSIDEQVSKWRHLKFRRRVSQQAAQGLVVHGTTCPKCGGYVPGHATGAGDICTCEPITTQQTAHTDHQAQARKVAEGMGRKTADAILLEHREVVDGIMSGGLKVVAARDTMARIITDAITTALLQFAEQFGQCGVEGHASSDAATVHSTCPNCASLQQQLDAAVQRAEKAEAERDESVETCRTLVKNVEQPELKGASALVLYFPTDADREELIAAFKAAKPNCKTIKL